MRRLLVAVTAATLALSGCSAAVTGSPAPVGAVTGDAPTAVASAPTNDPVEWSNNVCGALLPLQQSFATAPDVDGKDPAATVKALSASFAKAEIDIDQALARLNAVGPAPVNGGDAVVAKLTSSLTTVRSTFDQVKTAVDKVDPNNPSDLITALPQAAASLQELSKLQDPTTDLQKNPELKAAFSQAPNCQALKKSN